MIKITRPEQTPTILLTEGKSQLRAFIRSYNLYQAEYQNGTRKFDFDSGIYGHPTVKEALIAAQFGKCCYCESKLTHISYGDIEHFRPKSGYQQGRNRPLTNTGYYWLAYDWKNLLFSCQICNQRYKRNLFPLSNPRARAKSHSYNLTLEKPLLINPYDENPESHISFRKEVPFAVRNNLRGRHMIDTVGLDRPELQEVRLDHYDMLKRLYRLTTRKPQVPESLEASAILDEYLLDESEFAGLARAGMKSKFRF